MTPWEKLQRQRAYLQTAIEAVSIAASRHLALTGTLPLHYTKAHDALHEVEVILRRAIENTPES